MKTLKLKIIHYLLKSRKLYEYMVNKARERELQKVQEIK